MKKIAPQWIVENLENTVDFYVKNLGFNVDWKGTLFSIISREGVTIMLRQLKKEKLKRPNSIPFMESGWNTEKREAWDAYIWLNEVDEFYKSIKHKNIKIIKEIQNTEYGIRDFEIEDNNGYILCFGKEIE